MTEIPGVTVGDSVWALAVTVHAYCRNVGAEGLPTPSLLCGAMADLVTMIQEHAWDDACQEAFDCGLMHDAALGEMRGRNPFRGALTPEAAS